MLSDRENSRDTDIGTQFTETTLALQLECNIGTKESDAKGLKLSTPSWQKTFDLYLFCFSFPELPLLLHLTGLL